MSEEELIEVLRQFDEKRVEELPEKTRNIFYAIMKIADERDELENIRKKAIEYIGTDITARALEQLYTNYELGESLLFVKTAEDLLKILNKGEINE